MKRQWQVRQRTVRRPDAQGRWDRAHQCVLRWTLEAERASGPGENGKEEYHAGGGLRAVFAPRFYTLRGAFLNILKCSRKFQGVKATGGGDGPGRGDSSWSMPRSSNGPAC